MTSTTKTQQRGHCQCCGRVQAVPAFMSKHGYTVEGGHGYAFFQGVCPGQNFRPIEQDRSEADNIVAYTRSRAAALIVRADDIDAGRITVLEFAGTRYEYSTGRNVDVAWADADAYSRRDALKRAAHSCRYTAKSMQAAADQLEALCDRVHGQPLQVVTRDAGPAPIAAGERRAMPDGRVCTAKYVEKGRVVWTMPKRDGGTFSSWTGSAAWRRMPVAVEAVAA